MYEAVRVINDRASDGIEVKWWWRDVEPPEFFITVMDHKLNQKYPPIPASLEDARDIFLHPMSYLADIATKSTFDEVGLGSE